MPLWCEAPTAWPNLGRNRWWARCFFIVPGLWFEGAKEKIKMAFLLHQFNLNKRAWRASRGAGAGAPPVHFTAPQRHNCDPPHYRAKAGRGMRNWTPSPSFLICLVHRPLGREVEISIWSCLDHHCSRRSSIQVSFCYGLVTTAFPGVQRFHSYLQATKRSHAILNRGHEFSVCPCCVLVMCARLGVESLCECFGKCFNA